MNVLYNLNCENCGAPMDNVIITSDDNPLVFCSKKCFIEYRLCDGGDDGYYDLSPADDTDTV